MGKIRLTSALYTAHARHVVREKICLAYQGVAIGSDYWSDVK